MGWAVTLTVAGAVLMVGGIHVCLWDLHAKRVITYSFCWVYLGDIFVFGVVASLVGFSCWDNTLVRIDDCPQPVGIGLSMSGWVASLGSVLLGLLWPCWDDKKPAICAAVLSLTLVVG